MSAALNRCVFCQNKHLKVGERLYGLIGADKSMRVVCPYDFTQLAAAGELVNAHSMNIASAQYVFVPQIAQPCHSCRKPDTQKRHGVKMVDTNVSGIVKGVAVGVSVWLCGECLCRTLKLPLSTQLVKRSNNYETISDKEMEAALSHRKAPNALPVAGRGPGRTSSPRSTSPPAPANRAAIAMVEAEGHYTALPESAFDGITPAAPAPTEGEFGAYGAITSLQAMLEANDKNKNNNVDTSDGVYSAPPPPADNDDDVVNQRPLPSDPPYQSAPEQMFRQPLVRQMSTDNKRPAPSAPYGATPTAPASMIGQPATGGTMPITTPGASSPVAARALSARSGSPVVGRQAASSPIVNRLPSIPGGGGGGGGGNMGGGATRSPVPPTKAPLPTRMAPGRAPAVVQVSRTAPIRRTPVTRGALATPVAPAGGRGAPAQMQMPPAHEGAYSDLELIPEESAYDDVEELDVDSAMVGCNAPHLADRSWYFGNLPRERAQSLLDNQPAKTFLVRDSSQAGAFVFTVMGANNAVKNILAQGQPDGGFKFGSDPYVYSSLEQLIETYRKQTVPTLIKALSRF